ncbi:MAG: hypothetical protein WBG46_01500 [Nonlabens sp.]
MRPYIPLLLLFVVIASCSSSNYRLNKGLVFNYSDWGEYFEQPYVMIGENEGADGTKVHKMFLSGQLFKDVEVEYVYFQEMKSDMISWNDSKSRQLVIIFDEGQHKLDEPMYGIGKNQAVVFLKTKKGKEYTAKLEDIRLVK